MLQNIIAYTVILIAFVLPMACIWPRRQRISKNLIAAIVCLCVAGWIATVGMAYHVRSFNEAKQEMEARICP